MQGGGINQAHSPFIQIGTAGVEDAGTSTYGVFWSDTADSFQPTFLSVLLDPGDMMDFGITRISRGWLLRVSDLTTRWTHTVSLSYGKNDSFSQAEWVQEDPTASMTVPANTGYASTTPITIRELRVNGVLPKLTFADRHTLSSPNDIYLVPSAASQGSFSFVHPTGYALQYLEDTERFNVELDPLEVQTLSWRGNPSRVKVQRVDQLARLFSLEAHTLTAQSWPVKVDHFVNEWAQEASNVQRRLAVWMNGSLHSTGDLGRIISSADISTNPDQIRRSLGLPPA